MKIEDCLCSPEYSKILDLLPIPKDSLWHRFFFPRGEETLHFGEPLLDPLAWKKGVKICPAYLTDELLFLLPRHLEGHILDIYSIDKTWFCWYKNIETGRSLLARNPTHPKLVDALSEMLYKLVKDNYLVNLLPNSFSNGK